MGRFAVKTAVVAGAALFFLNNTIGSPANSFANGRKQDPKAIFFNANDGTGANYAQFKLNPIGNGPKPKEPAASCNQQPKQTSAQAVQPAAPTVQQEIPSPDSLVAAGNEYLKNGKTGKAIREYWNALKIDMQNPDAWLGLGKAYGKRNFLFSNRHSLVCFQEADMLRPNDLETMGKLAEAYLKMGRFGCAVDKLTEAVRSYPNDLGIRFGLVQTYLSIWQNDEFGQVPGISGEVALSAARWHISEARRIKPGGAVVLYYSALAEYYSKKGDLAQALIWLETAKANLLQPNKVGLLPVHIKRLTDEITWQKEDEKRQAARKEQKEAEKSAKQAKKAAKQEKQDAD